MEKEFRPTNAEEIEEEQDNFLSILAAFKHYRYVSACNLQKLPLCADNLKQIIFHKLYENLSLTCLNVFLFPQGILDESR